MSLTSASGVTRVIKGAGVCGSLCVRCGHPSRADVRKPSFIKEGAGSANSPLVPSGGSSLLLSPGPSVWQAQAWQPSSARHCGRQRRPSRSPALQTCGGPRLMFLEPSLRRISEGRGFSRGRKRRDYVAERGTERFRGRQVRRLEGRRKGRGGRFKAEERRAGTQQTTPSAGALADLCQQLFEKLSALLERGGRTSKRRNRLLDSHHRAKMEGEWCSPWKRYFIEHRVDVIH